MHDTEDSKEQVVPSPVKKGQSPTIKQVEKPDIENVVRSVFVLLFR